jgi:iron complex outermembrane receptor protein
LYLASITQTLAAQAVKKIKNIEKIEVKGTRAPLYDARDVNAAALGIKDPLSLPISIQSFSEELIVNQRARTLGDILSNDASVQNTAIGNVFDFVSLRGFQLDWTNGLRRDGLALAPFQDVPLENIQRIDVLKGPSSLLSGFNNPGGTVNYVTKRPTLKDFVEVSAELRSRDGKYIHLDTSGKFSADPTLAYRFNAAIEDTGDFTGGDDLERHFISAAIDWQASDDFLLRFDLDYQDKSVVSQPLIGLATAPDDASKKVLPPYVDTSDVLLGQPWARYETQTLNIALRADYWLSDSWQWVTQVAHAGNDRFTIFPDIYEVNTEGDVLAANILVTPDETYRTLSGHSFLSGTFATGGFEHELVAGLSLRDYESNDGRWFDLENPVSNLFNPVHTAKPDYPEYSQTTRTNTTESSLFITDKISLTENSYATLGLRHIRYKKQQRAPQEQQLTLDDESFNTPILAVNYTPNDDMAIYVSYSEGAGEGSVAVIGSGAINEGKSLGAQESEQLEAGIKYRAGKATFTFAVFEIEKMLEYHNKLTNYFVQDGVQSHQGIELNVNGEISDDLSIVASFTAMDAEISELAGEASLNGNRPANVPKIQANVFFDYRVPIAAGLNANLGVFYVGKRQQNVQNTLSMPSYTRVDLGLRYELTPLNTTLRLKVENLFAEEYWLSAGAKGIDWGVTPGRGRTLALSATVAF